MASVGSTPIHQGGRTLAKMGKKGGGGGGTKKTRRPFWFADGSGFVFDRPYKGEARPEDEPYVKVMKTGK